MLLRPVFMVGIMVSFSVLAGCNPANFGITWPSQKDWHREASTLIDQIEANGHLDRQEVEERVGKPDAVVLGETFVTGQKELDAFRAFTLRLAREPNGDASRLYDHRWRNSTILVYDEKAHYPWPIVGDWRAYLFQVHAGSIIGGWDTYPNWTPWQDSYWDDVRDRMKDGD